MQKSELVSSVVLVGDHAMALDMFASACETDASTILILVEEGLVFPQTLDSVLCFDGEALARVRKVLRLQRDFEANLQSVAVMIDLLDENDRLRAQLRNAYVLGGEE
jgi:chaperone modulatory protein CbpM